MRYSPNRRFSVFQRGSAWASHVPKIDLSYDKLFFLLTFCSHLSACKPALSKESIESNHVNTLSKSSLCSHFCSYFRGYFYKQIGTSSAKITQKA